VKNYFHHIWLIIFNKALCKSWIFSFLLARHDELALKKNYVKRCVTYGWSFGKLNKVFCKLWNFLFRAWWVNINFVQPRDVVEMAKGLENCTWPKTHIDCELFNMMVWVAINFLLPRHVQKIGCENKDFLGIIFFFHFFNKKKLGNFWGKCVSLM